MEKKLNNIVTGKNENINLKDQNLELLNILNQPITEKIKNQIIVRQQLIKELLEKSNSDPGLCFKSIFGKSSSNLKLEIRSYGIYFYGEDDEAFKSVYPRYIPFFNTGAAVTGEASGLLKDEKFINMVGFGSERSKEHEFVHLFNTMLPLQEINTEYQKIKEDISLPKDKEGIYKVVSKQYELWVNSVLKDEILARIDNKQIMSAEQQEMNDPFSGPGKIFSSYKPEGLYDYVSPYEADTKRVGLKPFDKKTSKKFWDLYDSTVDPIIEYWLEAYNKNLKSIQDALKNNISSLKIKKIVIEEQFQDISSKIETISN